MNILVLQIEGITKEVLNMTKAPSLEELHTLDSMYVSYFIPWNSITNYEITKKEDLKI